METWRMRGWPGGCVRPPLPFPKPPWLLLPGTPAARGQITASSDDAWGCRNGASLGGGDLPPAFCR